MRNAHLRPKRGAITAEYVATLWIIFLIVFFPFLDLTTICLRSFFLWFAANQAALIGSQAKTWQASVTIGTVTYQPASGATGLATTYANEVKNSFLGWQYDPASSLSPNPYVEIVLAPIGSATPVSNSTAPLASPPDVSQYVPHIRVTIDGLVQPLVPMYVAGLSLPGLTTPMKLRVRAEAIFENPNGLTI
jgi:hypothetical protein